MTRLSEYCDEFLVHGVDVEGMRVGILVRSSWLVLLACSCIRSNPIGPSNVCQYAPHDDTTQYHHTHGHASLN